METKQTAVIEKAKKARDRNQGKRRANTEAFALCVEICESSKPTFFILDQKVTRPASLLIQPGVYSDFNIAVRPEFLCPIRIQAASSYIVANAVFVTK